MRHDRSMGNSRAALWGVLALLTLIWGTTWAAIRVGLTGIPPFTGVALRFAIAAALLGALAWARGVPLGREPRERRLWLANGLLSFAVSYGVVYWSEQYVPSGLASILWATFPLFVAVLAHFALPDERLTGAGLLGVLIGFGGVTVIFSEDLAALGGPRVAFAASVMLVSPAVSAVSNVAIKKWGAGVHPLSLTVVPMAIGSVAGALVAFATERGATLSFTPAAVAALLYLAIFGSAVSFTLYYWALDRLPASRIALMSYFIPVIAVLTGALFLDEPVTGRTLSGAGLVIAGVVLALSRRRR